MWGAITGDSQCQGDPGSHAAGHGVPLWVSEEESGIIKLTSWKASGSSVQMNWLLGATGRLWPPSVEGQLQQRHVKESQGSDMMASRGRLMHPRHPAVSVRRGSH